MFPGSLIATVRATGWCFFCRAATSAALGVIHLIPKHLSRRSFSFLCAAVDADAVNKSALNMYTGSASRRTTCEGSTASGCGKCVDACPLSSRDRLSGPLALPTREVTIAALWDLLYPQLDLLRNVGGITASGGEPLLQSHALRQLLRLCREAGIHTAVETSGALPTQHLADVVALVDCWLFGLRPTPFYKLPGAGLIEDNLAFLTHAGSRVIARTPVMVGITDLPQSLDGIAIAMRTHRITEIELLPFHDGTPHYYDASGMLCLVGSEAIPSADRLEKVKKYFHQSGFMVTIIQ